ncbi:carbohydrate kinase family protein [Arsenicibacter rosenii]|uniref:Carbohydrate kinase n=1 Tax=Arsenicibacter rosenii TaxID=1750698 RepID=A0A1S2VC71_9BACT|nr:carbohydrate kinase [Arsenicibacter rosenii]OIN56292.1 carbohydrate kinase [Arsenicibacter rosenii]
MSQSIICFGEVLWDVLPTGKQAGGAPMNVAVHLRNFGMDAHLISRVGSDEPGLELLAFLRDKSLPTAYVQVTHTHPTGVALANVTDRNEVVYTLVQPVAWDFIQYDNTLTDFYTSSILVYGSLVARSETSRQTLQTLLSQAALKVFDVNLRAPFYTPAEIDFLLKHADIVKLNHHELAEVCSWYTSEPMTELQCMEFIKTTFNIKTICVTRGERGAILLTPDGFTEHPGFRVSVEDTIGSGDSFLAAFLSMYLAGEAPEQILHHACAVGAYVATQRGATPLVTPEALTTVYKNLSPILN